MWFEVGSLAVAVRGRSLKWDVPAMEERGSADVASRWPRAPSRSPRFFDLWVLCFLRAGTEPRCKPTEQNVSEIGQKISCPISDISPLPEREREKYGQMTEKRRREEDEEGGMVRQSEEKCEFCRTSVLHLDVSRSSAPARAVCVALKQRHIFNQH